jgi:hypothetical protein
MNELDYTPATAQAEALKEWNTPTVHVVEVSKNTKSSTTGLNADGNNNFS